MSKSSLKSKNSPRNGRLYHRRSKRTTKQPNPKPYGFCCSPDLDDPHSRYRRSIPTTTHSIPSLHSLHECPALRIREQFIVKRTRNGRAKDGTKSPRSSSTVKLNLQSLPESGGMMVKQGKTESDMEFMIDLMRRRRQEEYERNMDRWAAIGEKRVKRGQRKIIKLGVPHWYTEFSVSQLQNLKELEDAMFKDKEEKTTRRTWRNLDAIGIFTDTLKVESKVVWKLIKEFSTDPITFLCEIYKTIKGNYFQDEDYRTDYMCNERIILSAIAFLELPKIIVELHKRMPPVLKQKFPPKPKPPKPRWPRKMESPFLEKLLLPLDWRLYRSKLLEWRKKIATIPKPFAVLPKQINKQKNDEEKNRIIAIEDVNKKKLSIQDNVNVSERAADKKIEKHSENKSTIKNVDKLNEVENSLSQKTNIKSEKIIKSDKHKHTKEIETKLEISAVDNEENEQNIQSFSVEPGWTEPPTPCPDKYRKLFNKKGPLNTDEEFFAELKSSEVRKSFPCGRENMSLKMQHYLLNIEADFFHLTEEANRITSEVGNIAREIFDPEPRCDPCCACRQTRKTYRKWHTTKAPHSVIDAIITDEDNNTHVIGGTAMHSPAESMSSVSQLPCIPSSEKLTKNLIIAGTATTVDGEIVNQVAGITKVLKHVPREILRPELDIVEIKNVYPCSCADKENEKLDTENINGDKDDDICYGQKFRPKEVRAYSCKKPEVKNEAVNDCGCGDEFENCVEDDCGCGDDTEMCLEDEGNKEKADKWSKQDNLLDIDEKVVQDITLDGRKKDSWIVCKRCGKELRKKCTKEDTKSAKLPKLINSTKPEGKVSAQCSCDSLLEFLQIDVTRTICVTPKKRYFEQESIKNINNIPKKESEAKFKNTLTESKNIHTDFKNKVDKANEKAEVKKIVLKDKKNMPKLLNKTEEENKKMRGKKISSKKIASTQAQSTVKKNSITSDISIQDHGGPYGYRTKSEEALPIERTIAYLTPLHPPDHLAERIPVRPGGRPCRCRENHNKRKTLLYGINGLVAEKKNENVQPVIEGITWVTPEPSIRRSNEYIPEYELYDSPYEKQICGPRDKLIKKSVGSLIDSEDNEEDDERGENEQEFKRDCSKDWETAFKDSYLTEFFTKKREKVPCWNRCSKFRKTKEEPRKLKVMKPVCECKYERRIVKRNEERKKWRDRQQCLKSLKKESYLHIHEVSAISGDEETTNETDTKSCIENPTVQTTIAGITMQTPYATPTQSREVSNLPFVPVHNEVKEPEVSTLAEGKDTSNLEKRHEKSANKNKQEEGKKRNKMIEMHPKNQKTNTGEKDKKSMDNILKEKSNKELTKGDDGHQNINQPIKEIEKDETAVTMAVMSKKFKTQEKFLDQLEEKLLVKIKNEIEKMKSTEDFVSLKLPDYHHMPQLYYWIFYRVRGMRFTEKYKKDLMENTMKVWSSKEKKVRRVISAELFHVSKSDQHKFNFDRAKHWKRKVGKLKSQFYTQLRQKIINFRRDMWGTMEFGKFPNILFKQAYFTYLPARDRDAIVFRPWPL